MTGLGRCIGRSALFDSTDLDDHAEAKALCDTCPVVVACERRLADFLATGKHRPEGTWAGRLFAAPRNAVRVAAEDAAYSVEEARRAHAAAASGDTSEWARTGDRVYNRRSYRRRVERQRAS